MDNLFKEFPTVSTQQWIEQIKKDLKNIPFEKLYRKTLDQLLLAPFYRKEDTENLPFTELLPGETPYIRPAKNDNSWLIRLNIYYKSPQETNKKIKKLITDGVQSIGIDFKNDFNLNINDLETLIKDIDLSKYPIHFISLYNVDKAPMLLHKYALKKNIDFSQIKGSINFDPYTKAAFIGNTKQLDNEINKLFWLYTFGPRNFKLFSINIDKFANAGASTAQQIAIALSIITEYLNFALENDINPENILKQTIINFAIGSEFLLEIAKISAFRYLFSKLIEAYDQKFKTISPYIHLITTRRNKTIYDPYVNMIRTSIEALAAVAASADLITVEPFDIIFKEPDQFSERIAKNQQLILKHEAYLDKVIDPYAGSFYIENIKKQLIEKAWEIFLSIDKQNGYTKALKNGYISEIINKTAQTETDLVKKGKIALLGTNKYPNRNETLKERIITQPIVYQCDNEQEFIPLKIKRLAEDFEKIRMKTENFTKEVSVFLFTYGNIAMRRARADFSANFFATAGFKIIDNTGFETIEQGLEKWQQIQPEITVLCSSDDQYLPLVQQLIPHLSNKTILVIAGYPDNANKLKELGIEHFIHIKSHLYNELVKFQNLVFNN